MASKKGAAEGVKERRAAGIGSWGRVRGAAGSWRETLRGRKQKKVSGRNLKEKFYVIKKRGVGREKEEGEMEGRSPTLSSIREGSKQSF